MTPQKALSAILTAKTLGDVRRIASDALAVKTRRGVDKTLSLARRKAETNIAILRRVLGNPQSVYFAFETPYGDSRAYPKAARDADASARESLLQACQDEIVRLDTALREPAMLERISRRWFSRKRK